MTSRIILVRHGRSAHRHGGEWIDREGVLRWLAAYDAAGIDADSAPPPPLRALAAEAGVLAASDLPRALASVERLAPGRLIHVSPLLRESALAIPARVPVRLPLVGWATLIHARWIFRAMRGSDATAAELERAAEAARWLASLAADGSAVLALTHGVMRRLVGMRLVREGWRAEPRSGGYRHWSAWTFRRR